MESEDDCNLHFSFWRYLYGNYQTPDAVRVYGAAARKAGTIGKNDAEIFTIGYKFNKEVVVNRVYFMRRTNDARSYIIQGSNNGSTWNDIYSFSVSSGTEVTKEFSNTTPYQYIKVQGSVGNYAHFMTLQFYDTTKEPTLWQPKGLVPNMTSNTAPYGEASASGTAMSDGWEVCQPYRAFNGTVETIDSGKDIWHSSVGNPQQWLQYKFANPTNVVKFKLNLIPTRQPSAYDIQASNDGSNWDTLKSYTRIETGKFDEIIEEFENDEYYLYYRINVTNGDSPNASGNKAIVITALQFYGRRLEALIPPMTSDTTPIGEASCIGEESSEYAAYKAFDGNDGTVYSPTNNTPTSSYYLKYDFGKKYNIRAAKIKAMSSAPTYSYTMILQGSNDDVSWSNIGEGIVVAGADNLVHFINAYSSNINYRYYRLSLDALKCSHPYARVAGSYALLVYEFQLYGTPDYESRTYIYDHGVEVMNTLLAGPNPIKEGQTLINDGENLYAKVNVSGSSHVIWWSNPPSLNLIDFSKYSVIGITFGNRIVINSIGLFTNAYDGSQNIAIKVCNELPHPDIPHNWYVDVSNVNTMGSANIGFNPTNVGNEYTITEWWLE